MARAKRHYIPGQIWHITHRCHKREFLFKLQIDRQKWLYWLYEAKKRYGLIILNYAVTSNHVHLLVFDAEGRDVIPQSIKLIAGRTKNTILEKIEKVLSGGIDTMQQLLSQNNNAQMPCIH